MRVWTHAHPRSGPSADRFGGFSFSLPLPSFSLVLPPTPQLMARDGMAAMAAALAPGALCLMMEERLGQTGRLAFDYRRTRSLMSTTQDTVTGIPFCPKRFWHLMKKVPAPAAAWAHAQILAPGSALSAARPMHPPRDRGLTSRLAAPWPACAPGRVAALTTVGRAVHARTE